MCISYFYVFVKARDIYTRWASFKYYVTLVSNQAHNLFLTVRFLFSLSFLDDNKYMLKMLIPSTAAGSIIGKGGQTIAQLQRDTGTNVKLSKANDFYPGLWNLCCRRLTSSHQLISCKILIRRVSVWSCGSERVLIYLYLMNASS